MDVEALKREIKEVLGDDVQIREAKCFTNVNNELLETLYNLYNSYPDAIKIYIRRYIPSGQPIEFYVGMMHNQRMLMEFIPFDQLNMMILQSVSVINARVGYVVRDMSPTQKSRFCSMLNSILKNIKPGEKLPLDDDSNNNG